MRDKENNRRKHYFINLDFKTHEEYQFNIAQGATERSYATNSINEIMNEIRDHY